MGAHKNLETGVVVRVADDKDDRFLSGWEPYDGDQESDKKTPAKRASSKSEK